MVITGTNIELFGIAQQCAKLKLHKAGFGKALSEVKKYLINRGYEIGTRASADKVESALYDYSQDYGISIYPFTKEEANDLKDGEIVDITLNVVKDCKLTEVPFCVTMEGEEIHLYRDGIMVGQYDCQLQ
jgi:hypothetical protein